MSELQKPIDLDKVRKSASSEAQAERQEIIERASKVIAELNLEIGRHPFQSQWGYCLKGGGNKDFLCSVADVVIEHFRSSGKYKYEGTYNWYSDPPVKLAMMKCIQRCDITVRSKEPLSLPSNP